MKFSMLLLVGLFAGAQPADTSFVKLSDYSRDFVYDMKYATEDNFLKSAVYPCGECMLRYRTAKALIEANEEFLRRGYRIKIFDCYRPLDVQRKMWAIVNNPSYVADPSKGSIHNRGGAVDMTLVDESGNELDMGTGFDHFGPESAVNFNDKKWPAIVRKNRNFLIKVMKRHGFTVLPSEWWHFNYKGAKDLGLSNESWDCP
jgi:D-alanyl-D-alanine dipeptidase